MADNLTFEQRTKCMKNIKSKWTSIEMIIHNYLKGYKIKHIMHPKIEGSPDIILKEEKIAIYVNGCFWHKCPKCYNEPKSNLEYWLPKIEKNVNRDKKNIKSIRSQGYSVKVYWEHDLKRVNKVKTLRKIIHLHKNVNQ